VRVVKVLQGQADLAQVALAGNAASGFAGLLDRRQKERDERADDRDDDQELDQGEGAAEHQSWGRHSCLP
jgi:hypothetical protein